jgi:hypothetical protein
MTVLEGRHAAAWQAACRHARSATLHPPAAAPPPRPRSRPRPRPPERAPSLLTSCWAGAASAGGMHSSSMAACAGIAGLSTPRNRSVLASSQFTFSSASGGNGCAQRATPYTGIRPACMAGPPKNDHRCAFTCPATSTQTPERERKDAILYSDP